MGIEGRCFSTVFKDVQEQKSLPRDVCFESERCVPCFNPATGQPTGACSTVSCDKPKTSPPALNDCSCGSTTTNGKCVSRTDVPITAQSHLLPRSCSFDQLCVPTADIDTEAKPAACATDGGRGVCVSECVVLNFVEQLFLDRGSCKSDETCIPCVDPTTHIPTGLPGCE
jgi:hypothetical protein